MLYSSSTTFITNTNKVIQSIEFATGDDEDDDDSPLPPTQNGTPPNPKPESLELLLLARNKKLSNELTILRVSHNDLQSRLSTLQSTLSHTTSSLEKSQKLTQTLEQDLERVQEEAANNFPSSAMSVAGTYRSQYPSNSMRSSRGGGGGRNISPTSSIISGFTPSGTPEDILRSGIPVGGGSGMLPMITAQRDRYKKKNSELEGEIQKLYAIVQGLRGEIASLQKDNLTLYEKSRYISTYSRSGASGSAYAAGTPRDTAIDIDNNIDNNGRTNKYKTAYENTLSPFAAFKGRESARVMRRMNRLERGVFQLTKVVLATRTRRNLFAVYWVGVHVLLMVVLVNGAGGGLGGYEGVSALHAAGVGVVGGVTAKELDEAGII